MPENTTNGTTSLADKACQVGISFGLPRQSIQDEVTAAKIEQENNAQRGVAGTSIYYFKKMEGGKRVDGLDSLKKFQARIKTALYNYARFPYMAGTRILPAGGVAKFMEVLEELKAEEPSVWMNWTDEHYPYWYETRAERMGNFNRNFPTLQECRLAFIGINGVKIGAIGAAEQIQRISLLSPDVSKLVMETTDAGIREAVAQAAAQNWRDVLTPIQHIVDVLQKDKAKLHDSMIENLIKIVDLVPSINMDGDQHLANLARTAKEQLGSISVDDLRESAALKAQTLNVATNIINTFTPYARKFGDS